MSTAVSEGSKELNPTRDDFAALLSETLSKDDAFEGSVVKGKITAIEKDLAVIDVGLKMEGRVPLREFSIPGKPAELKVGDTVEVYLERIENALGEAVLSRDKARREESWTRLEEKFNNKEQVEGVIFNKVKGGFTVDLDGAVAFLPGSQVDVRPVRDIGPLMHQPAALQDPQDGSPPRQHRRLAPRDPGSDARRAALRDRRQAGRGPGDRRPRQEHHRLRRLHRPRRHRRPAARHRHGLAPRQSPERDRQRRRHRQGADRAHQPRDAAHQPRHEAAAGRSVGRHRGQVSGRRALQGHRHQHRRLRRLRGAGAGRRRPDPRLRDELDQEEHPSRQDRLHQPAGRRADPRGRRPEAPHLARPQADPGQSVGCVPRRAPEGRGQVEGPIRNITEFGLFIGLDGGVDGMVHLSDLDWNKSGDEAIKDYKKGDTVKAVVLDVDAHQGAHQPRHQAGRRRSARHASASCKQGQPGHLRGRWRCRRTASR